MLGDLIICEFWAIFMRGFKRFHEVAVDLPVLGGNIVELFLHFEFLELRGLLGSWREPFGIDYQTTVAKYFSDKLDLVYVRSFVFKFS